MDLANPEWARSIDQFIAGRDNTDPRAGDHRDVVDPDRGADAEMGGAQRRSRREDDLSGLYVVTGRANVVTDGNRLSNIDRGLILRHGGEFNHDHRVGTRRHRCTGHDSHGLTFANGDVGDSARSDGPDHRQRDRSRGDVGGANRKSVHCGVIERWDWANGGEVRGGHQIGCIVDGHGDRWTGRALGQNELASFGKRNHRPQASFLGRYAAFPNAVFTRSLNQWNWSTPSGECIGICE